MSPIFPVAWWCFLFNGDFGMQDFFNLQEDWISYWIPSAPLCSESLGTNGSTSVEKLAKKVKSLEIRTRGEDFAHVGQKSSVISWAKWQSFRKRRSFSLFISEPQIGELELQQPSCGQRLEAEKPDSACQGWQNWESKCSGFLQHFWGAEPVLGSCLPLDYLCEKNKLLIWLSTVDCFPITCSQIHFYLIQQRSRRETSLSLVGVN